MFLRKLVKSIFIASLVIASSGMAVAAAQQKVPQPVKTEPAPEAKQIVNTVPHLGVNLDLFMGYGFANWSAFTNDNHGAWAHIGGINPHSNSKGGFNIGVDLGYQIIRYLGIELGSYHFAAVNGDNLEVQSPYVYAATKVSYPFLMDDDLTVFAKLGIAYRMIEYNGSAQTGPYQNKRYSFNTLFGLGAQYYFSHRWKASIQWIGIPARTNGATNTKKSSKQIPMTNQLLLGLGYLFSI